MRLFFLLLQYAILSCGFRLSLINQGLRSSKTTDQRNLQMSLQSSKNGHIMTLSRFIIEATRSNPGIYYMLLVY